MLKSTLAVEKNIHIGDYLKAKPFLKGNSADYKPKKTNVLTREEVTKFLLDAVNEKFLLAKVIMITALSGVCRRDELSEMTIQDIKDKDSYITAKFLIKKRK